MRRNAHGFTLLELLLVVTIIGAVTALAMPRLKEGMVHEAVRGARRSVIAHMSRARATAASRGCRAIVHFVAGSSARVWVTSCNTAGPGVDTVGTVEQLGDRFKVSLASSVDSISYSPNGLSVGGSWAAMKFTRTSYSDTLSVSPLGKAVW
jgi:type IV fimbrial biogenesis protein FimT